MPLSNKEKCKRYREKHLELVRLRDANKKRARMEKIKENKEQYEEFKAKDRERKKLKRKLEVKKNNNTENNQQQDSPPFSTKQSLSRSVKCASAALPKRPQQKTKVLSTIISSLTPTKKKKVMENLRWKPHTSKTGRPTTLTNEEKLFLEEFFEREDISYTEPGRRDQVYLGKNGAGESVYKAKRYLLWNLSDLKDILNGNAANFDPGNETFKSKFGAEIKFSSLYRFLKTVKHVKNQSHIPQASCLCEICENLELLIAGIKTSVPELKDTFPTHCKDILSDFVCDIDNIKCVSGECEDCPFPNISSIENTESVSIYEWKTQPEKRFPEKVPCVLTGKDCASKLRRVVPHVTMHHYRKNRQHKEFAHLKSSIQCNEIIVHVDFSENYVNHQQDAIQSAYFGQESFTLYTINVHFRETNDDDVKHKSFAFVSKELNHDRTLAYTFNTVLLELFKQIQDFDSVHFWSDGCAAQFRSKFCFYILTKFSPNLKILWHYFESHHGKGSVDGIGGSVKNSVYRRVLSKKIVITSAKQFASYADEIMTNVEVRYIDSSLQDPCKDLDVQPVTSTRQVHCVERENNSQGSGYILKFYKVSPITELTYPFITLTYSDVIQTENENISVLPSQRFSIESGNYYAVYFEEYKYWYLGLITKIVSRDEVEMDFLQQSSANSNSFENKPEVLTVDVVNIFCKVEPPTPDVKSKGKRMKISKMDFKNIRNLYRKILRK